jgi:hypothetical protein
MSAGAIVSKRTEGERQLAFGEPLHHHLTGVCADGRGRQPGDEQRQRKGERGRATDGGVESVMGACERVDVGQPCGEERSGRRDQHQHVDEPCRGHRREHVGVLEAKQTLLPALVVVA